MCSYLGELHHHLSTNTVKGSQSEVHNLHLCMHPATRSLTQEQYWKHLKGASTYRQGRETQILNGRLQRICKEDVRVFLEITPLWPAQAHTQQLMSLVHSFQQDTAGSKVKHEQNWLKEVFPRWRSGKETVGRNPWTYGGIYQPQVYLKRVGISNWQVTT